MQNNKLCFYVYPLNIVLFQVQTIDRSTADTLMIDFIKNVSFTSAPGNEGDMEIFGYISNDERLVCVGARTVILLFCMNAWVYHFFIV